LQGRRGASVGVGPLREGGASLGDLRALVFDWGDTLMRDFPRYSGPMAQWPDVELIPGVKEALAQLDGKYVCCVASNAGSSDAHLMKLALRRVGIDGFFQHFLTSRELGFNKPDVRFFREVAHRLKIEPGRGVMIGNDYARDIVPARSVGMRTVLLEAGSATEYPEADRVIPSMGSLAATLRGFTQS
jgi:FMN phosphatase YigB (HAD superfamily)